MFGIGFGEMALIMVVALVILGPSKLPEIARSLGKGYAEFIRSMRDVREEVEKAAMSVDQEKEIFKNPRVMVDRMMENAFPPEVTPKAPQNAPSPAPDQEKVG